MPGDAGAPGTRRERIEERFGDASEDYAASEGHRGGPDLTLLIRLAQPTQTDVVLDLATGAGNTALAIASRVAHVVAADLSFGMARTARRRVIEAALPVSVAVADAERLPFRADAFDLAVCRIAPHHFEDASAAFADVARVVRAGGRFVLVDSASPGDDEADSFLQEAEVLRDPTHVRAHRPGDWARLIRDAGFVVERLEVVRKRHAFDPWVARAHVDSATARELHRRFLSAPPAARRALAIESRGGRVEAFTDDKVVVAALRP